MDKGEDIDIERRKKRNTKETNKQNKKKSLVRKIKRNQRTRKYPSTEQRSMEGRRERER